VATFYVYRDNRGEWRWTLKAGNNRTIADSGEGYQNERDCRAMVTWIKANASGFAVVAA